MEVVSESHESFIHGALAPWINIFHPQAGCFYLTSKLADIA
jgi:hypothetical protein